MFACFFPRSLCLAYIILDFLVGVAVIVLFFPLNQLLRQEVFKRGFFCNDESLRYSIKDAGTVSPFLVILVTFVVPLIAVVFQEYSSLFFEVVKFIKPVKLKGSSDPEKEKEEEKEEKEEDGDGEDSDSKETRKESCMRKFLKGFLLALLRTIYVEIMVLLAFVVTSIVTEFGKINAGRLRPFFFMACAPDFARINCTDEFGEYLYIEGDVCTGNQTRLIDEARKSWPSGHSSMAFQGMVFAMLIIYYMPQLKKSIMARTFLMLACFLFAFYTALSRVFDYWHHWSDVFSGALLGTAISLFVYYAFVYNDAMINKLDAALRGETTGKETEDVDAESGPKE